jgi:hypothetical protein
MKSYPKLKYFIFSGLLLNTLTVVAQFRKYSNEFLNIGVGARAMAMGGAQISSTGDGTSSYWNPAGLTKLKESPVLTLQHAEYFAGIGKYDFGSIVKPLTDGKRTVGLSVLRFAVDDIPNTLYLVEPDGTVNYGNISSFSSADYAVLLSFANTIKNTEEKKLSWGANGKIIYRKVGKFATALGFGFDVGIQSIGKKGGFAIVARDATSTFNAWTFNFTDREKEVLYLTNNDILVKSSENTAPRLSIGGYRDIKINNTLNLKAEGTLDVTFDGKRNTIVSTNFASIDPHMGLELGINKSIFIRGGITNFQRALADKDTVNQKKVWIFQPSAGVGFKVKDLTLDYAFSNLANQSEPLYTHIISLSLTLRKVTKNKK